MSLYNRPKANVLHHPSLPSFAMKVQSEEHWCRIPESVFMLYPISYILLYVHVQCCKYTAVYGQTVSDLHYTLLHITTVARTKIW